MSEQRNLKLAKPWGGHPAGAQLRVLGPGENPAPGTVDPARAATLVADKLAVESLALEPAPPAAKPKPNRKEA